MSLKNAGSVGLRRLVFDRRILFVLATVVCWSAIAPACPFCSALRNTLSDDLQESTAAVIARYESSSVGTDGAHVNRLRITDLVKGAPSLKNSVVEVESLAPLSKDGFFWLVGYGETQVQWTPPTDISKDAISYLSGLSGLPESGPIRLAYFLDFLQHSDEFVAADAYNEFADASLSDIASLKSKLNRQWVISQLRDVSVPRHRRRLCWTFLSQCGTAADVGLFDEVIRKREADPMFDPGMDAAISCFIVLGGEQALARIEQDYLANPNVDYVDCFAAINAIRVHGTELNVIDRKRLSKALRRVLEQPALAGLVISDLARWEDWSAIDRMVNLFKNSTDETQLLKPAVVRYLKSCPLPAASKALQELRAIDSIAVQSAESSMMFYSGFASVPVPPPDDQAANNEKPDVSNVPETPKEPRVATKGSDTQ